MIEPFLYLINRRLEDGIYSEKAPADFKDPDQGLYMIPMTSRVLAGDRGFYTEAEIAADKAIMDAARANTRKNQIRKNVDNDFISIRSSQTGMPCAVIFMLKSREKTFEKIGIDPEKYYMMFITADEALFAEKAKYKPTQIRKILSNIKNKMNSTYPDASPVLSTAIFEYIKDPGSGEGRYAEV